MGLLEKIIDKCTEPVSQKQKKKGILEKIYEACTKPVENPIDENMKEGNSQETSINFADSKRAEQIYESIKGKIQIRKRELRTIGQSLTSIDLNKIQQSSKGEIISEIIEDYFDLCNKLEKLINQQEKVEKQDATESMSIAETMNVVNLQSAYGEFEGEYQNKIQAINNLYWLSELKKQNKNMKLDFERVTGEEISDRRLQSYRRYIQSISNQKKEFTYKLGDELIDELIISEYRLKMLTLMRDVSKGEEVIINPFKRENIAKKAKYEELLLEDIEKASQQYEKIDRQKQTYISAGLFEKKDFKKINKLAEDVKDDIDLAMVDDLSISEVFTEEFDTIKKFAKLREEMNRVIAIFEQINEKGDAKQKDLRNEDKGLFLWNLSRSNTDDIGDANDEVDY